MTALHFKLPFLALLLTSTTFAQSEQGLSGAAGPAPSLRTCVVNGSGGIEDLNPYRQESDAGSSARFNQGHGALFIDLTPEVAVLTFLRPDGLVIDQERIFSASGAQPREVFARRGGSWAHYDLGGSPGLSWTTSTFDDSAWLTGEAPLGYGDGDENTDVSCGPDPQAKYATTYFRRSFTVAIPAELTELYLDLSFEDAVAVWLNDSVLASPNLPETWDDSTLSERSRCGAAESGTSRFEIDSSSLLPGTNQLAVEVHQSSRQSPDLSFDLELVDRP